MLWLVVTLALILLVCGWLVHQHAARLHQKSGLPMGRLVYADTASPDWQIPPQPLYAEIYGLTGKPDYLVETAQGLIPVEVKSSQAPQVPYLGHLLQLAAYCLLIEVTTGRTPPHGLLQYADALYEVDFTLELRQELLDTMSEIRQAHHRDHVSRSHQQPTKCAACGLRYVCNEALA